jgi:hypothetical protein
MTDPLSRSAVLAGAQCVRRLWLEAHATSPAGHPEARLVRQDEGRRVEDLAREKFPGGVRISWGPNAAAETATALADPTTTTLYKGVFDTGDVRVRVDILRRRTDGWELVDVRSGLKVKRGYLVDIGLQMAVLRAVDIRIIDAHIAHLRRGAKAGVIHPDTHMRVVRVTDRVVPFVIPDVGPWREVLALEEEPAIEPGIQCGVPWRCPYLSHCGPSAHSPHASPPPGARDAAERGNEWIGPDLLAAIPRRPVHFLDFEAFQPSLPDHPDIVPFDAVPFLWVVRTSGEPLSKSFLGVQPDPRRAFTESLLTALADDLPILVWSDYESKTLGRMAKLFTDLAPAIDEVRERIFDLHAPVRVGFWSAALGGMYSVKAVAAAFDSDFSYRDLAIRNGRDAALLALGIRRGLVNEDVREDLVAYCDRDVVALQVIHEGLLRAPQSPAQRD